jgi:hypothetical protein
MIRNAMRSTPWKLFSSNGRQSPLPSILDTVGTITQSGTHLNPPVGFFPLSAHFSAGSEHASFPVLSLQLVESTESPVDSKFLYLQESLEKDRCTRTGDVEELMDGYYLKKIYTDFTSRWQLLESGTGEPVSQLQSDQLPCFQKLLHEIHLYELWNTQHSPNRAHQLATACGYRIRFWLYQYMCFLREDLWVHATFPLEKRLTRFREHTLDWQVFCEAGLAQRLVKGKRCIPVKITQ